MPPAPSKRIAKTRLAMILYCLWLAARVGLTPWYPVLPYSGVILIVFDIINLALINGVWDHIREMEKLFEVRSAEHELYDQAILEWSKQRGTEPPPAP